MLTVDCPFTLPKGVTLGENARCGFLRVPEDRHVAQSPDIKLPVLVVESETETSEDALVLLNGGPGEPAQELLSGFFSSPAGGALVAERDVVFFEQRGTGYAEPALACGEMSTLARDPAYQRANLIEQTRLESAALQTCGARLTAEGRDLAAYNTRESAADVAALAEALGYEQLNLLGISYGTRLALQVARDYPQRLRSLVLSSAAPPQLPIGTAPAYAEEVLAQLFEDCATNAACAAAYPDLAAAFSEVYASLQTSPLQLGMLLQLDTVGEAPFDGTALVALIYEQLYGADGENPVPALLYSLREGETGTLQALLAGRLADEEAPLQRQGMKTSVNCADEKPFIGSYSSFNETARPELLAALSVISESQFATRPLARRRIGRRSLHTRRERRAHAAACRKL